MFIFFTFNYLTSVLSVHLWFTSIIDNLAIKSPKNVTAATWFRYFFLCTSCLPDWIRAPITPHLSPGKFSEVCTKFSKSWISSCLELNRSQLAPLISSNYKKMWEITGYLYGVGQSPKGHQCVKECIVAMSLRMRCNPGRFRLDKTDRKVIVWSDF